MSDEIDSYVRRFSVAGLLVDTNLMLVSIAGQIDPKLFNHWGRVDKYDFDDFETLQRFIRRFNRLCTTPNVLSEVSNLLGSLRSMEEAARGRALIHQGLEVLDEVYVQTRQVSSARYPFVRFGVTDCVIAELCTSEGVLVLTDDLQLENMVFERGGTALNFNHIR